MKPMLKLVFLVAMLIPVSGYSFFGTLGKDQCGYDQQPAPTSTTDYTHAANVQADEMEVQIRTLNTRAEKINTDIGQIKTAMQAYFGSPWCDSMMAHMDNGFDCCGPQTVAANDSDNQTSRLPAGNEVVEYQSPPANTNYVPAPDTTTSCNGQPAQYCSSVWGNNTHENTSGQHCLQTGFAATPAFAYACRDGGNINPEICSNTYVTQHPQEYQRCIKTVEAYRKLAVEKRTTASQIEDLRGRVYNTRNPNRPQANNNNGAGFMQILSALAPIGLYALSQFMGNRGNNQSSYTGPGRFGPRHIMSPYSMRAAYGSTPETMSFMQDPGRPPAYYGPNYGAGFSNNGVFGQILPALLQGAFGCSTGTNGAGMNLLSLLSGGASLNLNASLGSGANYDKYTRGWGNRYSGVPAHTFGDRQPLYQPGGIYGTTRYDEPRTRGGAIGDPIINPNRPYVYNASDKNYLGSNVNSFYYAQQLEQEEAARRSQSDMDMQLLALRASNGNTSVSNNYQMVDLNALLPSLFANPSEAGANLYFNASGTMGL